MNTKMIEETMKSGIKKIGILTGGGDCPGLNAVVRAVVLMAKHYGVQVIGIPYGYRGMFLGGEYFKVLFSVPTKITFSNIQNVTRMVL